MNSLKYQAMVVGASAGGIESFKALLEQIGTELKIPVLVVQHIKKSGMTNLAELFAKLTGLMFVKQSRMNLFCQELYILPC